MYKILEFVDTKESPAHNKANDWLLNVDDSIELISIAALVEEKSTIPEIRLYVAYRIKDRNDGLLPEM